MITDINVMNVAGHFSKENNIELFRKHSQPLYVVVLLSATKVKLYVASYKYNHLVRDKPEITRGGFILRGIIGLCLFETRTI